jgi:hypothetical protein
MSVERSRKAAGTKIMIEDSRSGKRRPAVGLRPEDNALNPYDRVIQIDATGKETVLNQGSKVRTYDVTSVVQMLKDQIKAEGGGKAGVAKVALKYGVPAAGLTTFLLADDDQREQMAPMLATVFGGKAMSARRGDVKMGESKVGWFSDRNASVNDGVIRTMRSDLRGKPETGGAKLSDLITHPKLFSEYPWVKEIPVVFKSMAKGNMEAQAIINRGNIMDSRIEVYSANRKTPREILRDLGHEWQHLIDEYENFKHGELNAKATGNDIMTSATNPGRTQ